MLCMLMCDWNKSDCHLQNMKCGHNDEALNAHQAGPGFEPRCRHRHPLPPFLNDYVSQSPVGRAFRHLFGSLILIGYWTIQISPIPEGVSCLISGYCLLGSLDPIYAYPGKHDFCSKFNYADCTSNPVFLPVRNKTWRTTRQSSYPTSTRSTTLSVK